ncbi:MAG: LysR family transcriptional regulator [Betaproteobacteria bacterium]
MELSDLQVFRAVVEAGGITRAAARLHRVQSNVTTRVKNLEQQLGVALFVREGKRMQLSPQGRILFGYAQRLLALADEARAAVLETGPRGSFRLGAMESTAAARLPALLALLHERHPAIVVELHTGAPRELTAQVIAGELDAALVAEPVSDDRLLSAPAYVEELIIVGAAGHRRIASAKDVAKRTLLAFEPGCPHRQRLEDWFARDAIAPDRIVEMGSYHAILGCAVAGMGVALMPRSVLDTYSERDHLSVHRLWGDFRSVRTLLIWRRDAPQANVAAFAALLAEHGKAVSARRAVRPTPKKRLARASKP